MTNATTLSGLVTAASQRPMSTTSDICLVVDHTNRSASWELQVVVAHITSTCGAEQADQVLKSDQHWVPSLVLLWAAVRDD